MLLLLSPAKSLNLTDPIDCSIATQPIFDKEKKPIVDTLKKLSSKQIESKFSLSTKLAELNFERYQNLGSKTNIASTRQAIFSFDGDVYVGFDAYSLNKKQHEFTQKTVRILSGLYGILKPFDLIEPYRLEMGSQVSILKSKNLYEFWSDRVTNILNEELTTSKSNLLLNLASNEYSKVVQPKKIDGKMIEFEFLEEDKKELKNISFYSKKARGLMARYIIDQKIKKMAELMGFDYERYTYHSGLSTEKKLVFTRKYQPIGKK